MEKTKLGLKVASRLVSAFFIWGALAHVGIPGGDFNYPEALVGIFMALIAIWLRGFFD